MTQLPQYPPGDHESEYSHDSAATTVAARTTDLVPSTTSTLSRSATTYEGREPGFLSQRVSSVDVARTPTMIVGYSHPFYDPPQTNNMQKAYGVVKIENVSSIRLPGL